MCPYHCDELKRVSSHFIQRKIVDADGARAYFESTRTDVTPMHFTAHTNIKPMPQTCLLSRVYLIGVRAASAHRRIRVN
jgi:hypothetical protein